MVVWAWTTKRLIRRRWKVIQSKVEYRWKRKQKLGVAMKTMHHWISLYKMISKIWLWMSSRRQSLRVTKLGNSTMRKSKRRKRSKVARKNGKRLLKRLRITNHLRNIKNSKSFWKRLKRFTRIRSIQHRKKFNSLQVMFVYLRSLRRKRKQRRERQVKRRTLMHHLLNKTSFSQVRMSKIEKSCHLYASTMHLASWSVCQQKRRFLTKTSESTFWKDTEPKTTSYRLRVKISKALRIAARLTCRPSTRNK